MKQITLLEQDTIDKIAAGEVIERPSSVVKELVENAIDAGSNAITVEIRDGGISFIRITDNGEGIPGEQVPTAFLRHATSKIRRVEDLQNIGSLGFRGEALSSIAAVCQVELITRTAGSLTGVRYLIEGGKEKGVEEIGAPEGSTFLVRNLFFNTPARKKFLKSPVTEAGYVSDLLEHLALSHPEISFKFISNGQTKLHTSGNCSLKDIIYSIYGRDIAANLVEIRTEQDGVSVSGYIGKPVVSRGNRNFENYFVNGRYVKSSILAKAIEEGYRTFLMQHRYPFTVLRFEMDGSLLDVNVHPTKMELRFADGAAVYELVCEAIKNALSHRELIPEVSLAEKKSAKETGGAGNADPAGDAASAARTPKPSYPEPFERVRRELLAESQSPYQPRYPQKSGAARYGDATDYRRLVNRASDTPRSGVGAGEGAETVESANRPADVLAGTEPENRRTEATISAGHEKRPADAMTGLKYGEHPEDVMAGNELEKHPEDLTTEAEEDTSLREGMDGSRRNSTRRGTAQQMELFDDKLLSRKNVAEHRLIGQIFDTYWIVQFRDSLYIIDQHAAHEKVMYERLCSSLKTKEFTTQRVSPPIILTLSMQEENLLKKYEEAFREIGFEIEPFGGREFAICGVPDNLFGITDKDLFVEMLDSLSEGGGKPTPELLNEKLATMACKSAVKGNSRLSATEANALIQELLGLENPYNCPHGRPTIISMSKYELEKKFKRIV